MSENIQKPHQRPSGARYQGKEATSDVPKLDTTDIKLEAPAPELFDSVAEKAAQTVANSGRVNDCNKSTQLRRFYDEIVMWDQRIRQSQNREDDYRRFLPLIKMLNAKATYAAGRKPRLVDQTFVDLLKHCLAQLTKESPAIFFNFKLFMEAFMGFYKLHGPK